MSTMYLENNVRNRAAESQGFEYHLNFFLARVPVLRFLAQDLGFEEPYGKFGCLLVPLHTKVVCTNCILLHLLLLAWNKIGIPQSYPYLIPFDAVMILDCAESSRGGHSRVSLHKGTFSQLL